MITLLILQPAPVQPAAGSPEPPVANLIDLGGETPPVPPTSASAQLDPFAKPTLPPNLNERYESNNKRKETKTILL